MCLTSLTPLLLLQLWRLGKRRESLQSLKSSLKCESADVNDEMCRLHTQQLLAGTRRLERRLEREERRAEARRLRAERRAEWRRRRGAKDHTA